MRTPENARDNRREAALGVVYGVAAYSAWGIVPVFWKQLRHVGAVEILAHRTVWSLLAFAALTLATGQLRALVAALRDRRVVGAMAATGALVSGTPAPWAAWISARTHAPCPLERHSRYRPEEATLARVVRALGGAR
ncbi:hypothetical protein [Sorangium sp. So ce513]|uniref:hypothetical protein n=1 Tax=Sorangium sp. So ce513 TaxID=3133315 RepID=UPI003F640FB2